MRRIVSVVTPKTAFSWKRFGKTRRIFDFFVEKLYWVGASCYSAVGCDAGGILEISTGNCAGMCREFRLCAQSHKPKRVSDLIQNGDANAPLACNIPQSTLLFIRGENN
jgi:hypothetical protein